MLLLLELLVALLFALGAATLVYTRRGTTAALTCLSGGAAMLTLLVAAMYFITRPEGAWKQSARIAWTGLESNSASVPIKLGCGADVPGLVWPNNAGSPCLTWQLLAGNRGVISIQGNGAFMMEDGKVKSGVALIIGARAKFQSLSLERHPRKWYCFIPSCDEHLRLIDARGNTVGDDIPIDTQKQRVILLLPRLESILAQLRMTNDPLNLRTALDIEIEAGKIHLFIGNTDWRAIDETSRFSEEIDSTAHTWELFFPLRRLTIHLDATESGAPAVLFHPQWIWTSPLPEPAADLAKLRPITVAASALPGDFSFLLPVARDREEAAPRIDIVLEGDRFYAPDEKMKPALSGSGTLSEKRIGWGDTSVRLAIVTQNSRLNLLSIPLFAAILLYVLAVHLLFRPPLSGRAQLISAVLLHVFWTLLVLRLMMALRYGSDASRVDGVSVEAVAFALFSLIAFPVALAVGFRTSVDAGLIPRGLPRINVAVQLLAILAITAVFSLLVPYFANSLWDDLPSRYMTSVFRPLLTRVFFFLAATWLAVLIVSRYILDGSQLPLPRWLVGLLRSAGEIRCFRWIAGGLGPQFFWPMFGGTQRMPGGAATHRVLSMWILGAFALMVAGLMLIGIAFQVTGGTKFIQEIVSPLLLCWMPAILWISSRAQFPPGSRVHRRGGTEWAFWMVTGCLLVGVPVFCVPWLMKDAGGVISTVSVFLPLSLLLISGWAPLRICGLPLMWLVLAVSAGSVTWIQFGSILEGPLAPGELGSRVIAFRGGDAAQTKVLHNPTIRDGNHGSITAGKIAAGIQHGWENRAMIHQGNWWGLGFGNAPSRRSQIPQDTLQADSTFSFFIASEHGWVGAISLLLIYALPFIVLLLAIEGDVDIGLSVALVVGGSFLLEAIFHSAMNVGLIPFSGRNLPLLSANSPTDGVRWAILFGLALRALAWNRTGDSDSTIIARAVVQFRMAPLRCIPVGSIGFAGRVGASVGGIRNLFRQGSRPRFFLEQSLVPSAALVVIALGMAGHIGDPALASPFHWGPLMQRINQLAQEGKIRFDFPSKRIVLDPTLTKSGVSLLEQEVARFNALPESVRLHGAHASSGDSFHMEMRALRNIGQYDEMMKNWRSRFRAQTDFLRPLLLELEPPNVFADAEGNIRYDTPLFEVTANNSWNSSVSFEQPRGPEDFPVIGYGSVAQPVWTVAGEGFRFAVPATSSAGTQSSMRILVRQGKSRVTMRPVPYAAAMKIEVELPRGRRVTWGTLRGRGGKLQLTTGALESQLVRNGRAGPVLGRAKTVDLELGDVIQQPSTIEGGVRLAFSVGKANHRALVGPAWVMGHWRLASNDEPSIPWTRYLMTALPAERKRLGASFQEHYRLLTLRPNLQEAAQRFTENVGRSTYDNYIRIINSQSWRRPKGEEPLALPPRVAIAVVSLPVGEVRAMGGWPRMSSSNSWGRSGEGDWKPPGGWLSDAAPPVVRRRYEIERNFDSMVMGSSTKPLWGTIVERIHPGISQKLSVRGDSKTEDTAFGIKIADGPWKTESSKGIDGSEWCDFSGFLAYSSNRFQVRQGLLALAVPGERGVPQSEGPSTSVAESMGNSRPWGRMPKFDNEIGFSSSFPDKIHSLEKTKLAAFWDSMYGVPVENEARIRRSFWTGDGRHDYGSQFGHRGLDSISPPSPNFAWSTIETTRIYISMLLGGATNRWANVDFAAAYGTAITGKPYVPHILEIAKEKVLANPTRESFAPISAILHRGSEGAVNIGTLSGKINPTVLKSLRSIPGVHIYAKTGTLDSGGPDDTDTSRVVMAIVRWDETGKSVKKGLVFSLVIENSRAGEAVRQLGRFMETNLEEIRRELVD